MSSAPPAEITCVDCGGTCHLISLLSEDEPLTAGTVLAYRCADCRDRWDVVWEPEA
jgi:hypothetical protein